MVNKHPHRVLIVEDDFDIAENIADYLVWPRMLALSEVAWTEQEKPKWKEFQKRASDEGLKRLKVQGIYYRPVVPIR